MGKTYRRTDDRGFIQWTVKDTAHPELTVKISCYMVHAALLGHVFPKYQRIGITKHNI